MFRLLFRCALAVLVMTSSAVAVAQETASDPAAAPAATETAPEAPREDLTARSQESRAELDAISIELEELGDVADDQEWVDQLQERVDALLPAALDLEDPDIEDVRIREIRTQAETLLSEVGRSTDSLTVEAEKLEALAGRIKIVADSWAATGTEEGQVPPALAERISGIIELASSLREEANDKLNGVVGLQNTELEVRDRLNNALRELDTYNKQRQTRLLVASTPPLWTLTMEDVRSSTTRSQQNIVLTAGRDFAVLFAEHVGAVVTHVLSLPLVLIAMVLLKRRTEESASASQALKRPIAMAVLVWLLLGTWLYLEGPLAVRAIVGMVLAVSAVSVLLSFLPRNLKLGVLGLVALFIIERLAFSAPFSEVVPRLVYLGLGLAMAGISALGARKQTVSELSRLGLNRTVLSGLAITAVVLNLAGVAMNVLGYAQFGKLMVGGSIRSVALLLVLYTSLTTLSDLLSILFELKVLDRVRSVARNRRRLYLFLRRPLVVVAFVIWAWGTLAIYEVSEPVLGLLSAVLGAEFSLGGVNVSVSGILAFVLAVWLAVWASRITRAVLNEDVLPRMALPRGIPHTISVTANYAIIFIGVMIGIGYLGIDLSSLALVVGALGVGIGFGLQNLVNNFVSGLILIFERPIQVGDAVEVGALFGHVSHIGMRTSRVRTFDGAEVIVPNGDLASNQVINWTLSDNRRRLEVNVGVAYGTDPELVTSTIHEVLVAEENVMDDPAPMVLFEEFGDSSLNFRVLAWIGDFNVGLSTRHRLVTGINAGLARAGIQIPFPQRDLHLKTIPPDLAAT